MRDCPPVRRLVRARPRTSAYKSNRRDRERGDDNKIAPRDAGLIYEELIYAGRVDSSGRHAPDYPTKVMIFITAIDDLELSPGKRRWGSQ